MDRIEVIVTEKANKGSCVVVRNRNDYIEKAEKQSSDEKIYKDINFKDKILKEFQVIVINCLKVLKRKGVLLKKNLSTLLLNLKGSQV